MKLPKQTLEAIIESYTRESGVRELEKKIGKILRKVARQYATDGTLPKAEIKPEDLYDYLGVAEYTRDKYQGNDYAGVVTGLAWTAVGGEILFVETSLSRGKGGRLTLTGNLGDVMKESAMLALEYIKEKILAAKRAGIKEIILSEENRKNIDEIQDIYLKGLTFHYVKDVKEVFALALTDEKVADAIDLTARKDKEKEQKEEA